MPDMPFWGVFIAMLAAYVFGWIVGRNEARQ